MEVLKKVIITILLLPFIAIGGFWIIGLIKLVIKDEGLTEK